MGPSTGTRVLGLSSMDPSAGVKDSSIGTRVMGLASMDLNLNWSLGAGDLVLNTGDSRTNIEISVPKHRILSLSVDIYSYFRK